LSTQGYRAPLVWVGAIACVVAGCGGSVASDAGSTQTLLEHDARVCAAVRKPTLGVPPSGFTYGPYRGHTNLSVSEQRKIIRRFVYRRGHFKGIILASKAAPVYLLAGYKRGARRLGRPHLGQIEVAGHSWASVAQSGGKARILALFSRLGCFSFGVITESEVSRQVASALAHGH